MITELSWSLEEHEGWGELGGLCDVGEGARGAAAGLLGKLWGLDEVGEGVRGTSDGMLLSVLLVAAGGRVERGEGAGEALCSGEKGEKRRAERSRSSCEISSERELRLLG